MLPDNHNPAYNIPKHINPTKIIIEAPMVSKEGNSIIVNINRGINKAKNIAPIST